MSEERHPNLNAAGLTVDILAAIRERVRGDAKGVDVVTSAFHCVASEVICAVARIEEIIDLHAAAAKDCEKERSP